MTWGRSSTSGTGYSTLTRTAPGTSRPGTPGPDVNTGSTGEPDGPADDVELRSGEAKQAHRAKNESGSGAPTVSDNLYPKHARRSTPNKPAIRRSMPMSTYNVFYTLNRTG